MKNNYTSKKLNKSNWLSKVILICFLAMSFVSNAQTTIIGPANGGDFESGATFALNNWTAVNGAATNKWVVGTAVAAYTGNSAYISNDAGVTNSYGNGDASVSHIYRDVVLPAGETNINLSFQWLALGESGFYDALMVSVVPTTYTPLASTTSLGISFLPAPHVELGRFWNSATVNNVNISIPAGAAGNCSVANTVRLVFSWKNDGGGGSNPAASIDNVLLTSNSVSPLASIGTFTINNTLITTLSNFNNFTDAVSWLNSAGGCGPLSNSIVFNVSAGQVFTNTPLIINASGDVTNTITFQKNGAGANPLVVGINGVGSTDAVIAINGGDYITFDGIDVKDDASNIISNTRMEYGYLLKNSSALNGAQYNTIKNCSISLNNTYSSTIAILQTASTTGGGFTPSNITGANANNKYYNLIITNTNNGIYLNGNATYLETGNEIGTTVGGITKIGADYAGVPTGNIGGGTSTSYGIQAFNQSGVKVFNCIIQNIAVSASIVRGIYLNNAVGNSLVYNNKVKGLRNSSTSSTSSVNGMELLNLSGSATANLKAYNNFVSDITSAYTGTVTATRVLKGILLGSGAAGASYDIDNNSILIDGSSSPTLSSVCLELGGFNAATNLRNNIFSNITGAQTGIAVHCGVRTNSATIIGAGSVVDYNNYHIPNTTNGFVAITNTANQATIAAFNAAIATPADNDLNSITVSPQFLDVPVDLHSNAVGLDGVTTLTLAWITTDIDNEARNNPGDIGADEYTYVAPSCLAISTLGVYSITTNSAILSWTNGASETVWDVEYGVAPYTFTGTPTTTFSGNPATLNSLLANTNYNVKVRANCGPGNYSLWSSTISFVTACGTQNVPYSLDFNAVTTPNIPTCTTIQDINGGTTWITATAPTGMTGNSLKYGFSSTLPGNDWFFTNGINLIAGQAYEIKFNYGNVTTTWTEKLKVMYGASANAAGMTLPLLDFPSINSTSVLSALNTFTPATTGVYYFGFQAYSLQNQFNLWVDDIIIDLAPSCPKPNTFVASAISSSSMQLSWTNGNVETAWDIEYGISSYTFTGTPTAVLATNPATLTGLTASSTYQYRIRANCGVGDESVWSTTQSFTTPCNALTALPIDEGFNTASACWSNSLITGTINWAPANTNDGVPSPRNGANFAGKAWTNSDALLISPPIDLTAYSPQAIQMSVWIYRSTDNDPTDRIRFHVNSVQNLTGATQLFQVFAEINTSPTVPSDGWYNYTAIIPASFVTGGNFYVIAQGTTSASGSSYGIGFDDFNLDLAPACVSVSNIAVNNITTTSAVITWTSNGTETAWDIEYGVSTYTFTGTPTAVLATNPVTLTGLSSSSPYIFKIRANCGGSESTWSTTQSFTTPCTALTALPIDEGFDTAPACWSNSLITGTTNWAPANTNDGVPSPRNGANFAGKAWSNSDALLISPPFDLTAYSSQAIQMSVWIYRATASDPTDRIRFHVNTVQNLTGATQLIEVFAKTNVSPTVASAGWYNYTALIPASFITGGSFYVIAQGTTSASFSSYGIGFDDFNIDVAPTCPSVTNIAANNITTTSAVISWTNGNTETAWDIEYGIAPYTFTGTPTLTLTTNPFTLTSLTANTSYDIKVRANCGTGDESLWTSSITFNTACTAVTTFPFTEDFESVTTPSIPSCWNVIDANSDGGEWISYTGYGVSNSKCAGLYTDFNSGDNNDFLILPQLTLTGNQQLRFSVRARSTSEPNDYRVVLSTTGFNPSDFVNVIKPLTIVSSTTQIEIVPINLSTYSGNVYIAIHVPVGGLDGYYLYVDDVIVENIPTCPKPNALASSSITATSAVISWTNGNTETAWDIEYGIAPYTFTGTAMATATTNPFTLTGLTSSSSYQVKIRANCGSGDFSPWTNTLNFNSACGVINTPTAFAEGFDTYLPNCWTEKTGALTASSNLTGTTSQWIQDDFGNLPASGMSARMEIWSTGKFEWLISPSYDLGTANNRALEFDLALTNWNSTASATLGVDDKVAVVISTDNGVTWSDANVIGTWNSTTPISATGDHVTLNLSAYTGIVKFGLYAESTVSNADNNIYVDNFNILLLSNDATLSSIVPSDIGTYTPVLQPTFVASTTNYTVTLPFNPYSTLPGTPANVTATATNPGASVVITNATDATSGTAPDNVATIVSTSSDGTTILTYTITYVVAPASTDAYLTALVPSAGNLSPTFTTTNTNYTVTLILGSTGGASVTTYTTSNPYATVSVVPATDVNVTNQNVAVVTVTAEDGVTQVQYFVEYYVASSLNSDADLASITTGGTLSPSFVSTITNYAATLPFGTTGVSSLTVVTSDAFATYTINQATNVAGTSPANIATIVVTAQDGTMQTYTVTYSVTVPSSDATLSSLTTNRGTLAPAFSAGVYNYSVVLPNGSTGSANITGTVTNASATITTTVNATNVAGSAPANIAYIVVTAQNGTMLTYTVTYSVGVPSSDATLSSLTTSQGTLSPAFSAGVYSYTVNLPAGSTGIGNITGTVNNATATITADVNASNVAGIAPANTAYIVVTAQNGSTLTYTVVYSVGVVGINENSNETISINIVPNPTSGIATVNVIDNTSKAITISVVSITGQVISTDRIITNGLETNHTINLTNEAKGVYFIKVIGEKSIQTKRMVTF